MTVLVGGVGQLYQGDFDFGRRVIETFSGEVLGPGVVVEELHYGAVAVAQRLEDLRPLSLVLVGAAQRGRPAGTLERRRIRSVNAPPEELQRAVAEAVTGYVTIDLVLEVSSAFGVLPPDTMTIELEPLLLDVADQMSPEAERLVGEAAALAADEVGRARRRVASRARG